MVGRGQPGSFYCRATQWNERMPNPLTQGTASAVCPRNGMIWLPGGTLRMGSDRHYPEEAPPHEVTIDGFWIDETPVTNRDFLKFVNATSYVTFAELKPDAQDYPGALPHMLRAGSLVFTPPAHQVDLRDWSQWWQFKFGANWRRPYGPRSSISGEGEGIRERRSPPMFASGAFSRRGKAWPERKWRRVMSSTL